MDKIEFYVIIISLDIYIKCRSKSFNKFGNVLIDACFAWAVQLSFLNSGVILAVFIKRGNLFESMDLPNPCNKISVIISRLPII